MIENNTLTGLEVAVIGMAGRFPGAGNIHEFWENIKNGVESLHFFSEEEIERAGVPTEDYNHPDYVKSDGGILDCHEYFDADFFGYTPSEAELLDPQVRLFHECSWEALEDAGCDPGAYEGLIGLFAGAEDNPDWRNRVMSSVTDAAAQHTRLLLSSKDFVSARVSYKLNLKGPVYALVTGCSTALTSIHLACRSLLGGECDMALAGGVYLHPTSSTGYIYQPGRLQSSDGHLRAFDAKANGTVFSSGIGVVILKPLENAREDNDHIYALIKGSAVNCDGNRKVNFTAPSVKGQAEVIKAAYRAAGVDPGTIGYLETHGTGTPLGDPIEINALKQAFDTNPGWKCPIGSVKTNIGHLDVAAGAASFIKTVLILKYKLIPPSLHFETPNPKLEIEKSPFYVNTKLQELESSGTPRRAAVSSFGFGGTNAHAVLEEFIQGTGGLDPLPGEETSQSREYRLILLSAKTKTALDKMTQNLAEYVKKKPDINLADVAYTLQTGRQPFQYRKVCVGSNVDELIHTLPSSPEGQAGEDPPVVFMFSGQGSQYVNMGLEIYRGEPVFREQLDHGFDILKSLTGKDFKEIFYPSGPIAGAEEEMKDFRNIGPIKLIFEYSLAKLVMGWGIHPHALMGHSFGEYTAACLADVFSLEEALKLALIRGELILRTPPGGMMSVPLPEDQLSRYLQSHPDIYLTAVNSSSLCFVSGLPGPLDRLEQELKKEGLDVIRINVPCAGHSPMMKPITGEFAGRVREIKLQDPTIPFISGLTGDWVSPGQLSDPSYWAKHLEQPVRFCQGLEKLLREPGGIFVQVGADRGLPLFVNQHRDLGLGPPALNLVRHKKDITADMVYLLNQLGALWHYGIKIDWPAFSAGEKRQKISLPTYPFEGKRYWIDVKSSAAAPGISSRGPLAKRKNVSDWLYTLSWKRCCPTPTSIKDNHKMTSCLIFSDACQLGPRLAGKLEEKGVEVILVKPGETFAQESRQVYRINPGKGSDYHSLFKTLNTKKKIPGLMIHLWNVTGDKAPGLTPTSLETTLELGLFSLIHIAQGLGRLRIHEPVHLQVITDNMLQVVGENTLYPAKAAALGAVRVIPQEYPNLSCFALDIILPEPGSPGEEQLLRQLLDAFTRESFVKMEPIVALRGNHYWKPDFEYIPVEKPQSFPSRLREGGAYLVTGGLGGIGFVLAEYLAKTVKARLILTGRSQLPDKDQWPQWLDTHPSEDRVSQKIKKVMELEKWGAEVLVFSADSADQEQVRKVLNRAAEHFGQLNGIIHTAGLVDEYGVIQKRTREMTEKILAPKVKGTTILHHLTRDITLDFFILCSSIASLFPGFGEVGYAASNLFIDAFAHYKTFTDGTFTVAVNWDTWQEVGGAVDIVKRQKEAGKTSYVRLKDGIRSAEGVEAFTLILENPSPQVVVSTKNLHLLFQQYHQNKVEAESPGEEIGETPETRPQRDLPPRPKLSTAYAPPRNPTEKNLAKIWQDYFGILQVGIHDDFFELGGDSLMATIMTARIHKRMNIRIPLTEIFLGPTIEQLSQYIKSGEEDTFESIPLTEKKEYYPLSSAQKRLFILQQLEAGNISYNSPDFFILAGDLDKDRLEQSLEKMIRRHESLRTSFEAIEGTPVQRTTDDIEFAVDYYTGSEEEAVSLVNDFMRPFDLHRAPLLRVGLIKTRESRYICMFDMHHIITDGTSLEIFTGEFLALYDGRQLPPLSVQYKDFSLWQNHLLASGQIKQQEEYWLKEFAGEIPILDLPTDYPRPEVQSFKGRKFQVRLSAGVTRELNRLSRQQDVTLYMTTLALLKVFLSRLSGQETIIMGTSTAGRQHEDLHPIIGMFVNTLALKSYPAADKTFHQFLQEIKRKSLAALENQDYPFEDLVEKLTLNRDMSRNPLFDVMFSFQNFEAPPVGASQSPSLPTGKSTANMSKKAYRFEDLSARFDLTFFVEETADALFFTFEYCTKLFKQETIAGFGHYLNKTVTTLLNDPGVRLGKIEIISEQEKQRVLVDFNKTEAEFPNKKTIHGLFTEQVVRTPGHIAVVGPLLEKYRTYMTYTSYISYRELNEKSDRLAHWLIGKGVQADTVVSIMVKRSVEMMVVILAILKAGGAYLPIEPEYPQDRIDFILKDSNAKIRLTSREIVNLSSPRAFNNRPKGTSSHLHLSLAPATGLAYIIYTSGSTGKPRGVLVEHRSVVNILAALQKEYPLGERGTYLFKTSYLFDVSVTELFGWFLDCGRLAVLEKEVEKDPRGILDAIAKFRVTHINFVPSMFKLFVEGLSAGDICKLSTLNYIFLAGEVLPSQWVRKFRESGTKILLENIYGPTEGTIYSCNYSLSHWQGKGSIPIGKPMPNVKLYILDKHYIIQPVGIAGELCIGGVGVARGYLNNPELTAERFVNFDNRSYESYRTYISQKIYKTGDLARWYPDGNIQFLGRRDHQVKIRGFRIEPGEIESQLLKHPDIGESVVIARQDENGDRYLYAYIVPPGSARSGAPAVSQLREYLAGTLPGYMIPSHFVQLEKIPLTPNGKVDRRALASLGTRLEARVEYIPPATKTEKILAQTWQEVLKLDKISVHDKFFDLGGTSFDIVKVTAALKRVLKIEIPIIRMFLYPTIASLSGYLEQLLNKPGDMPVIGTKVEGIKMRSDEEIDASADLMEDAMQLLVEDADE